jgi:hypothetical protein
MLDIGAAAAVANKKLTPSVKRAIKSSPAGMFPEAARKAGIGMGSKLGQAITKSPTGKVPAEMQMAKSKVAMQNAQRAAAARR